MEIFITGVTDYYINDCRSNCTKIQYIVDEYKNAHVEMKNKCRMISETLLTKIDGK